MGRTLVDFKGHGGKVTGVTLDGGELLPADIVVVGAGAIPATGIFEDAEDEGIVNLARDDSILCDEVCMCWSRPSRADDAALNKQTGSS